MRKLFREFKQFISRGNILDLAVAVIVGGAFTAIITALTNKVLMPIINYILSAGNGLESAYTFLKKVYIDNDVANGIDLEKSIFIDWGAFITAILNFFLVALIIFIIIKIVNASRKQLEIISNADKRTEKLERLNKRRELRLRAIKEKRKFKELWAEYEAEKKLEAAEKARLEEEAKQKAEEEERLNNPTEKELLTQIRDLLSQGVEQKKTK